MPCHICGKLLSAAYITDHMRVHNQSQHHACHLCNRSKTRLRHEKAPPTVRHHPAFTCLCALVPQASPPSPTCASTPRSTTARSGRRAAGRGGLSAGPGPAACCSASCAGYSARRPRSSRVTWAPTPTRATPPPTRRARGPWAPPAWRSRCPVLAQWDCWSLTAPVSPRSPTASTLGGEWGQGRAGVGLQGRGSGAEVGWSRGGSRRSRGKRKQGHVGGATGAGVWIHSAH